MKTLIVIPARYRSSRFPGKPLADILGKPMIQHVYEKASRAKKADKVMVATDDSRIYSVVEEFGGNVVMTSKDHQSGTDRITEVVDKEEGEIYINLQGDQPLICPEDIDLLIDNMSGNPDCNIATLCHPISQEEAKNPNAVKVVLSSDGRALYFSRSLIPYARQGAKNVCYNKHIGIYGFKRQVLLKYKNLPFSQLERQEKLEQLRLLEAGFSIDVIETNIINDQGVDTPEDLEIVKRILLQDNPSISKEIGSVVS
jgi:3-deoxy-manno-octulosonate cytidylyltransferase (CMP-KDO synthetase)